MSADTTNADNWDAVKLEVRVLKSRDPEEEGPPTIVIEGDVTSLRFLIARLQDLLEDEDCGYHIQWGRGFYTEGTEYDLYLHRLPCVNEVLKRGSAENDRGQGSGF